jgi:hypothetical protein
VDGNDYLAWQRQFGNVVPFWNMADGNGNGVIDAADYVIWRDRFGQTCPAPAQAATGPAAASFSQAVSIKNAKFYPSRGEKAEINFDLEQPMSVVIRIYDRRGVEAVALFNSPLPSGHHSISWDGRDRSGSIAAPGTYTGVFSKDGHEARFKFVVIR